MSRTKIYKLLLFILSVSILSYFVLPVISGYAQEILSQQSIELTPPSQELNIDPGQTKKFKISIRNRSKEEISLTTRVEDFTASGEEGQIELVENSDYSVNNWTTITPKKFSVQAGATADVIGSIIVPKSAAGGRYGAVVFAVVPKGGSDSSETKVAQEIASLFLVKINGKTKEEMRMESFTAPQFSEYGPVIFDIKLHNSGNVHTKTTGLVNVTDMFNRKTADIVIPLKNVFPNATRVVPVELEKKFLIGRYTATAILYYGPENKSLTNTTQFYVFPLRLFVIAVIILILLFTLRKRFKKAFKVLLG